MTVALRSTGLLRALNEEGLLEAADVHVARRLGALGGETDESVLLAVALAVRGVRQGSVVLSLAGSADPRFPAPDAWCDALAASPLVRGQPAPLRLAGDRLWLDAYWRQEEQVAAALRARARPVLYDPSRLRDVLARLWPGDAPDDQREAAAVCLLSQASVLAGGPGTGKTTTVARLLAALRALDGPSLRVALVAPTGKAAARLQEAVASAAGPLDGVERAWLAGMTASTVHRLLGMRRGTPHPWHGPENRLPHDVVVVDEASMLSLPLFARLLAALRPAARLVLVGDPDQLASVEAGAVLADLTDLARPLLRSPERAAVLAAALPHDRVEAGASSPVRDGVARLRTVHRYDEVGAIADLADAVRLGRPDDVLDVLRRDDPQVVFSDVDDEGPVPAAVLGPVRDVVLAQAGRLVAAATAGDPRAALDALDAHRLLCAHRTGPRGVAWWSRAVERWLVEVLGVQPHADGSYPGLPLLVTANDPDNRLWNGDTGVVVGDAAVFARGRDVLEVPLGRLAQVQPLHAMTVHRSQGSQFREVTVLLPRADSPLGTRETLYTAVTRAEHRVHVIGSADAVRTAVTRPVARATGLRERLV